MKLRKFEATGVNGFMDFNIEFDNKLTFLTGINGSGKTTVLNFIASFLGGRWDYLIFQQFESMSIVFDDNDHKEIRLFADMKESSMNIHYEIDSKPKEISVPTPDIFSFFNTILNYVSAQDNPLFMERVIESSKLYSYEIFRYIFELPNLMYFGNDRISNFSGLNYVPRPQRNHLVRKDKYFIFNGNLKESLFYALNFVEKEIQDRNSEISKLGNKFREEVANVDNTKAIQPLLKKLEKNEKEILQKISVFFNLMNSFYHDSGKELTFESNGEIFFKSKDNVLRELSSLSSGEIELFAIFSHLFFNEKTKNANIFMIDEPELSLHLQWQQKFVTSLLQSPSDTQFIIGTHAPMIVAGRDEYCWELVI